MAKTGKKPAMKPTERKNETMKQEKAESKKYQEKERKAGIEKKRY